MKPTLIAAAELDRLETWAKYHKGLCDSCQAVCCTMPAEVRVADLIRLGVLDEFDAGEPPRQLAKRLMKDGVIQHFNQKRELFTLQQMSNGDCLYLDRKTRRCTMYDKRPDTCRNHPQIGPRPGYCAYRPR